MIRPLLTISLLVFVFLCVQSIEAAPSENSANHKSPGATGSVQPPSTTVSPGPANDPNVKQVETPVHKPEGDNQQGKAVTRAEGIQIGINAFIALVIFWQAWTYRKQRQLMEKQVEIAQVTERAYIGVKHVWLEPLVIGQNPTIKITFLNGGRTPAWDLRIPTIIAIEPGPPENPVLEDSDAPNVLPAGTDQTAQYIYPILVNQRMLDDINGGAAKIFVRGEAWFSDCWGFQQSFRFFFLYRPQDAAFQTYNERK